MIFNLKDPANKDFKCLILCGASNSDGIAFTPKELPKMETEDMASEEKKATRKKVREDAALAAESDYAERHGMIATTTTFTCGKCKQNKTTYRQLQTRSSDEPMTTFVTCLNCGNRWKFC